MRNTHNTPFNSCSVLGGRKKSLHPGSAASLSRYILEYLLRPTFLYLTLALRERGKLGRNYICMHANARRKTITLLPAPRGVCQSFFPGCIHGQAAREKRKLQFVCVRKREEKFVGKKCVFFSLRASASLFFVSLSQLPAL